MRQEGKDAMGKVEKIEVGDYDVRGTDLRAYYASFTRRALPEGALWRLSLASSCLPERHPGYKAWLTMVSGTDRFCPDLQAWAVGLGATIARMKPKLDAQPAVRGELQPRVGPAGESGRAVRGSVRVGAGKLA